MAEVNLEFRIKLLEREKEILVSELEVAKETIRELRAEHEEDFLFPVEWELTPKEAVLLNILQKNKVVTYARFIAMAYNVNEAQPDPRIIDVFIHHLRKKLKNYPVVIETARARGYYLTEESKQYLINLDLK